MFSIYVKFDEDKLALIIAKTIFEHNHAVSNELYNLYPKNRKMSVEDEEKVLHLMSLKTPIINIARHFADTENLIGSTKDLHNLKTKHKNERINGRSESELLSEVVESIRSDENNTVFQSLDETGILNCVVVILSVMKDWFFTNPQILHIDGTYKVHDNFILILISNFSYGVFFHMVNRSTFKTMSCFASLSKTKIDKACLLHLL
jgi:hypothetical protein